MKNILRYPPFHLLLGLIIGIYFQFNLQLFHINLLSKFILVIFLLILLFVFYKLNQCILFSISSIVLFFFIGIFGIEIQDSRNNKSHYTHLAKENSTAIFLIKKVLKPGKFHNKYEAQITQVNNKIVCGNILLSTKKDSIYKNLKTGDRILLKPFFIEIKPPLNPHQFNYKNYLATHDIYQQVFTNSKQIKIINNPPFSLINFAEKFRTRIQNSIKKHSFSEDVYAVINALFLGQRQYISKELQQNYSRAGAIHILAISGLHIGILSAILLNLLQPFEILKYGVYIKIFIIILLLWAFAFISGLSASVVRAVTMFTFIIIGKSLNRKIFTEHSLIVSMLLLLLIKPMFLFDVGFQLSYLAVFGIIWLQPLFYKIYQPRSKILNKFWQLFTVSVAAQIAVLPISLYYFHQFPSLFFLSNLIIIPCLGVIIIYGIIIITLSVLNVLPNFLAKIYGFIIELMNSFINWISIQEYFIFSEISMSFSLMIASYLVIIGSVSFFFKRRLNQFILFLVSLIGIQTILVFEKHNKHNKQEFIVFHKSRKSIIANRKGNKLFVYNNINKSQPLVSYKIGENIELQHIINTPSIFSHANEHIIRIDSLGAYKLKSIKKPIVILEHSPKINLERLIETIHPKIIIANGTNYKSYIKRWKKTCKKQKTPFHYTGENGAFILN